MEGQYLVDSYWNFNYEILFFYLHFFPQPTPPLNCKSGSGSGSQGAEACPSMHGDREKCTLDRSPVKKQHLIHIIGQHHSHVTENENPFSTSGIFPGTQGQLLEFGKLSCILIGGSGVEKCYSAECCSLVTCNCCCTTCVHYPVAQYAINYIQLNNNMLVISLTHWLNSTKGKLAHFQWTRHYLHFLKCKILWGVK